MKLTTNLGTVARVLAALGLVSTFIWVSLVHKGPIGYVAETTDRTTHVIAGTSPAVVLLSVLGILLFSFLMQVEVRVGDFQTASLQQRFTAFLFDLWFLFFTLIGVSSFIHLLLEAQRTGTFQWHFERNYPAASDGADILLVLVNLTLMVSYFVLPLARRRQTVGGWIFRLATVSAGGDVLHLPISTAAWRVFMELNGLIHAIRTVKQTDAQGRTWYDRETGLTVVRY